MTFIQQADSKTEFCRLTPSSLVMNMQFAEAIKMPFRGGGLDGSKKTCIIWGSRSPMG